MTNNNQVITGFLNFKVRALLSSFSRLNVVGVTKIAFLYRVILLVTRSPSDGISHEISSNRILAEYRH